jgi:titin
VTWIGWQTVTGLASGTSYDVQVYATNSAGSGLPSATFTVSTTGTAIVLPGVIPWIGAGDVSTANTVSFNFAAPYVGGAVTAYVLQYRVTGQSAWTTNGTVTWIGWQTITGLAAGTSYDVQVYATNSAGSGLPSAVYTVATTSD